MEPHQQEQIDAHEYEDLKWAHEEKWDYDKWTHEREHWVTRQLKRRTEESTENLLSVIEDLKEEVARLNLELEHSGRAVQSAREEGRHLALYEAANAIDEAISPTQISDSTPAGADLLGLVKAARIIRDMTPVLW
jgi:hypothetical protein